jgi:hypothetical protein
MYGVSASIHLPYTGSPAIFGRSLKTGGFASPPPGGFALQLAVNASEEKSPRKLSYEPDTIG